MVPWQWKLYSKLGGMQGHVGTLARKAIPQKQGPAGAAEQMQTASQWRLAKNCMAHARPALCIHSAFAQHVHVALG